MATGNPIESLQSEATCAICLEYFKDPVIIDCGHNFCRGCIIQCWEVSGTNFSCPECRQTVQPRNFKLNRQLANVVEITKQLQLETEDGAGSQRLCDTHQESLKLFCEEDLTPICMVCDRSKEHSFHTVVPIEEAAQDYKKNIQVYLVILNKKREKLLNFKASEAKRVREHLTEAERQKIVSEFEQLHQFLKDQEQLLLARLGELEREFVKSQEEKSSEVSKGISVLNKVIADLEEKCQQPASDFLQDIRRILNRCEKMKEFCKPEGISPELEQRLLHFSRKNIAVKVALKKFKDALLSELKTEREKSRGGDGQVNVTLDPETASPQLILSVDRKSVTWGVTRLSHPENPQRFDAAPCVLGCEGFTSGKHYWEVEVGDAGAWAVGVARESVRRKGEISALPAGGIWAVRRWGFQYQALTSPMTPLFLSRIPQRVRVSLDCEGERVGFSDADSEAQIFTFPLPPFTGERICPFFSVWGLGSQLTLYS
ncbi:zinc finger protein RFP-like isoform X2 [Alligator mississippiensis]|uniref:zinc finger protein RFP-like isoform X2 n=1 Tax=Alligator mississippiensis TaxID=8496 RepID=UPI00287752E5|nr:zinc finger protein RFP-like isoform X2 [Alligator mississippiensis]